MTVELLMEKESRLYIGPSRLRDTIVTNRKWLTRASWPLILIRQHD
jgi:hypothetical protein